MWDRETKAPKTSWKSLQFEVRGRAARRDRRWRHIPNPRARRLRRLFRAAPRVLKSQGDGAL